MVSKILLLLLLLLYLISLTGIVGTIKASLSESSDNNNQAIGMAVITSAFGTGLVIGPSLSGAIADPIGQYNLTISSKFHIPLTHKIDYFYVSMPKHFSTHITILATCLYTKCLLVYLCC